MSDSQALRVKHQLSIHLDFHLEADEAYIVYSYPFDPNHPLPEQRVPRRFGELNEQFGGALRDIHDLVTARIPAPQIVRLPHAIITPTVRYAYFTLAAQDQNHADIVPSCRLYYLEEVAEMSSRVEREIRFTRPEMRESHPDLYRRVRVAAATAKKLAWEQYRARFLPYFRD